MNELKAKKIIELEKERRKFFIYDEVGIDYPNNEQSIGQEIQQLKKEIMDEHNLDVNEVEEYFKYEYLFSHKIAKAINNVFALYLNEYDDLMVTSWKTLNTLKDLLYSQLLTEKGKDPFDVSLDSLDDKKINELQSQYKRIMERYAHSIAYKKLILLLQDILDAPLLNNLFKSDDFAVIDDIAIASEGIEAYIDSESTRVATILDFKNLRKIKGISLMRHDAIKSDIQNELDNITQDTSSNYLESESRISAAIQTGLIDILESITQAITTHDHALAIVPKYTNFANSNEFKTVMRINKKSDYPFGESFPIELGHKKKDISLEIKLTYDNEPIYLDPYDSIIYNNIATLREAGNTFITIDMIYRKMNGLNGKQRASKTAKQEIIERIERMRSIKVTADYRPLADFKKGDADFVKDEEVPILFTWKRTQKINGVYSEGYVFPHIPIFYDTAKKIHHIQNIDDKYLNLGHDGISNRAKLSNTRDRTIINTYLIQRIEDMKANNRLVKIISIDTVCEKLAQTKNIIELDRNAKKRAKDNIFAILDIQKENGLIMGYEGKNNGKSRGVNSIEIIF